MTRNASRTSDEPELDPRIRALLSAAAAPVETAGPLPGEDKALAAFCASPQRARRSTMLSRLVSAKAAVASTITTGVLLTGGVGAAAAGILPSAAQDTVSTWLKTVGISVPAGERADENGDQRGRSERPPADEANENADRRGSEQTSGENESEPPPAADHGRRVSETAKNSTAEGADKGKEIAGVASDGRVESGGHGSTGDDHGRRPVSPPNSGGTGTAPDATNGQEQSGEAPHGGTAKPDESSDEASSGG